MWLRSVSHDSCGAAKRSPLPQLALSEPRDAHKILESISSLWRMVALTDRNFYGTRSELLVSGPKQSGFKLLM